MSTVNRTSLNREGGDQKDSEDTRNALHHDLVTSQSKTVGCSPESASLHQQSSAKANLTSPSQSYQIPWLRNTTGTPQPSCPPLHSFSPSPPGHSSTVPLPSYHTQPPSLWCTNMAAAHLNSSIPVSSSSGQRFNPPKYPSGHLPPSQTNVPSVNLSQSHPFRPSPNQPSSCKTEPIVYVYQLPYFVKKQISDLLGEKFVLFKINSSNTLC